MSPPPPQNQSSPTVKQVELIPSVSFLFKSKWPRALNMAYFKKLMAFLSLSLSFALSRVSSFTLHTAWSLPSMAGPAFSLPSS